MSPTTFATFLGNLGDLAVAGVSVRLDEVPAQIGDLPCQWVQLPTGEEAVMTFDGGGGWPTLRAQLVVAVEAVAQGTQAQNWAATVAVLDALLTALRGVSAGTLGQAKPAWTVRMATVAVGGTDYWAAIADVTARG